ncbi:DUF3016 domain-containing protein [Thalassotalea crassostreae]|uniref:DUF3016 domain-containing protein n=1 Tax=Thalassotalea crassostreae TaxID=1763536 RepID=UPI000838F8EA|nr:DUF3016 domain-containing protein [Thalassotalea crassostreae]
MNRWIKVFILLLVPSFAVHAAQVEVVWQSADNYRDIKSANEKTSKFQEKVFKELEQHFSELANKLDQKQTLKITVHDVDLAGDIRYMVGPNNETMRIVRDIDFPKMKFDYQLLDASKNSVKKGSADIKDMGFMTGIKKSLANDSFHYEKNMIDDWFYSTFDVKDQ